jgi:aspartate aminotransferase-like enzyme
MDDRTIKQFVDHQNSLKKLCTAGPASLLPENIIGLQPCFGRGDNQYSVVEDSVLGALLEMSGHQKIVRMQGSASLALEVMALNFLFGKVLIVNTGFYSDRLLAMCESAKRRLGNVEGIDYIDWLNLDSINQSYDWIWACAVDTSVGIKLPIESLAFLAKRTGSRLMLDATASIGLEGGHNLADVIAYSSCKGLFGLTGAAFIAYNQSPSNEVDSFYLNLSTHVDKKMTGPYHAIGSLAKVLPRHDYFKTAVEINKRIFMERFSPFLTVLERNQPLLCTHISKQVVSTNPDIVLYKPRGLANGSVVCHLGEVHLGANACGKIIEDLEILE